jgi:phosphomannomutase/phosphoglucomutase
MLLARDNRLSSPGLAGGVARGFAEAGWKVVDAGVVPTPVFYWARVRHDIDAGVMVTGSHNEAIYNGLKLAAGPGTLYGEDIQAIGRLARAMAAAPGAGDAPVGTTGGPRGRGDGTAEAWAAERVEPLAGYVADVAGRIGPLVMPGGADGECGDRPLRVAVDCGSGTASLVVPDLLAKLGCEVIPLYCELDGTFPGHWPDPVRPENLVELREAVRHGRADAGVAFDGDADRLGVVDETGEILWGDVIMILFWREILAKHPGATAIVEVKCSQALVEDIRRHGGRPFFYRTGHSLIKAKMREIGALFAGEMSGHMFFADEYYGFDDAIYAAARLLRIVARAGRPLSRLLADRPRYRSTPEVRVDCPDGAKFGVVEAVREGFRTAGLEVVDVDGARVIFPDGGWLLVRASNTQPALVVRCEARTPERLEELKAEVSAALGRLAKEAGLTLPTW